MAEEMNSLVPILHPSQVTTIDFSQLHHDSPTRPLVIQSIHDACQKMGGFQLVNHGISQTIIDNALSSLSKFFDLPMDEKKMFLHDDVNKPVRYGSSQSEVSRDFIKLYSNPVEDWIELWPHNPTDFRQNVGKYAAEISRLGIDIMAAIMEGLGLSPTYLRKSIEQGVHMAIANRYLQCLPSSNILGVSSHTDHSLITILVENMSGLEILDFTDNNVWKSVPSETKGTVNVLVGSHLEVLSNGIYKSVFHRVTLSPQVLSRVSIGSFLSLAMEEIVEPAMELIDEEHPKRYRATSLHEYMKFLSSKEQESYIKRLTI